MLTLLNSLNSTPQIKTNMILACLNVDPEILIKLVASRQSMLAEPYLGVSSPPWEGGWETSFDHLHGMVSLKILLTVLSKGKIGQK